MAKVTIVGAQEAPQAIAAEVLAMLRTEQAEPELTAVQARALLTQQVRQWIAERVKAHRVKVLRDAQADVNFEEVAP